MSSASDGLKSTPNPGETGAGDPASDHHKGRFRKLLIRSGLVLLGLALLGGIALAGAEHYTSKPDFCGSCHIMTAHYESWSHDIHGQKQLARCVDCHYAPGEQTTIKAKFKGLSQVASYFSGRYGATRPRAHVADASCLRSNCHGDKAHFSKVLTIGKPRTEIRNIGGKEVEVQRTPSVHFVHEKHLEVKARQQDVTNNIETTKSRLIAAIGAENFARVEKVATAMELSSVREQALRSMAEQFQFNESVEKDMLEFDHLEHRRIRLDQLSGFNCSTCHTFNDSLTSHLRVDRQVCFTCHFTQQEFNRDTGECLRCHEPPRRAIQVHGGATATNEAVVMDHDDIVKRKVDCASCHLDVLRGDTRVTERDCARCHDEQSKLSEFAHRTTETVRKYHASHVANQRAHCVDCHRTIEHGLLDPQAQVGTTAGFLNPVLNNCQHCHPNHHNQQVSLLTGTGGAAIDFQTPNAMLASRLNCRACHTVADTDTGGDALVRATREGCLSCHSTEYGEMFDQWAVELKTYLTESEEMLTRVKKLVEEQHGAGKTIPEDVQKLVHAAQYNVDLVARGGGLHNRQYALQLLDSARRGLADAETKLGQ
ncbi:MAG: NapC/NirT family cytochrome c [Planctomycetes bacterium]|nr:NapC/NirT family cytochrome c [Planctomycetota bacterium]